MPNYILTDDNGKDFVDKLFNKKEKKSRVNGGR